MDYGTLKENIRDLAFEDDAQMEEYESIVVNAINRSISTISQEVAPIKSFVEVTLDGYEEVEIIEAEFNANKTHYYILEFTPIDTGYAAWYVQCTQDSVYDSGQTYYIKADYYHLNMPSLTDGSFLDFDDTPVQVDNGDKFIPFNDYDIETGDTIVVSGDNVGIFRLYYRAAHEPYTADTEDDVILPLPLKAHHLVPLLCAYYVWLDDDIQKATMYYNQYESLANALIMRQERPRMRVRTDWRGY